MRAYLGLGANIGNRTQMLDCAVKELDTLDRVSVTHCSRHYDTEPVGVVHQPRFLNMAVEIETDLEPLELLAAVKALETALGRVPSERWGPRAIDIDIVLMGDRVVDTLDLVIPHKEFRQRAFVLEPLTEIAPEVIDPLTGLSVAQLYRTLSAAP